jgi:hypothetical protein
MAKVTKGIISPMFVNEAGETFISLDGKAFLVGENNITEAEITSAPGEFRNLVLALNNFTVTNESLTWYHGTTRLRFVAETNKFYINNSEVLGESFSSHLIASGLVNYGLKSKISLFEFAAKNHNNFIALDFAQKIEEGDMKCYIMKLNEKFFVYRMNEANRIYTFKSLNANEAFDYVLEQTGHEITDLTSELLEGERVKAAEKFNRISVLQEMIAFLKDQRGVIAEADKTISEIKEADTLINSEIKRLEEEIENIKNNIEEGCGECGAESCECNSEATEEVEETEATEEVEETDRTEEIETEETEAESQVDTVTEEDEELVDRQDGYVPGTLKYGNDQYSEGTEIQIDAEGYTTSAKDDVVNVFIGDTPLKISKREIELADGETI